jgi:hypothetical protein
MAKPNRFGCRPRGDVCMQHEEPLTCKHGCEQAPLHKCPELFDRSMVDAVLDRADARELLRHTDDCMRYAAQTGKAFCIGPCSRLRVGEMTAAEYLAEVKRT